MVACNKDTNFELILLACLCAVISVAMTTLLYPFIYTADGDARWQIALQLLNGQDPAQTLLAPMQIVVMSICYWLTHSYAAYTLFQSAILLFSLGLLSHSFVQQGNVVSDLLRQSRWFSVLSIVIFCPITIIFSIILTDSSGTVAGLALVLALLFQESSGRISPYRAFYYLSLLFGFLLAFGFRLNSITTIPAFLLIIFCFRKCGFRRKMLELFCMGASIVVIFCIPRMLNLSSTSPEVLGWTWEMVSALKKHHSEDLERRLKVAGDVPGAVKRFNNRASNEIFWGPFAPFPAFVIATPAVAGQLRAIYLDTIISNPIEFAKSKLELARAVFGISEPLIHPLRGVHFMDGAGASYGIKTNAPREFLRDLYVDCIEGLSCISLRPFQLFLLSFVLVALCPAIKALRPNIHRYIATILVSFSYYAAFVINTQAMEFRYYAPAFFLLFTLCVSILIVCLHGLKSTIFISRSILVVLVCGLGWAYYFYASSRYSVRAAPLSDGIWDRGVSVQENMIVFENRQGVRHALKDAYAISGANGEVVQIVSKNNIAGDWVSIFVSEKKEFLYSPNPLVLVQPNILP